MSYKIPKQLKCKLCTKKFNNPLFLGAKVAGSICTPCRHSFFSAKTIRELSIDRSKEEFIEAKVETQNKLKKKQTSTNNNYITLGTYEGL